VIVVEDAIAHCDPRHGGMMLEWLVAMYELTVSKSDMLRASW
jgi:hypothetical protein